MLGPIGKRTFELVDYLVQTCPSALEKKNPRGETPLMVACRLGRTKTAKILIEGNADQTTRNNTGENIVHISVINAYNARNAHRLRALLDVLDPDLRATLFTQRKNLSDNGYTPIQLWVARASSMYGRTYHASSLNDVSKLQVEVMKVLLEYSKGQGLDLLDSAGDTCLHTAIMAQDVAIAKTLVEHKPALLFRENAVGRTPAEITEESFKSKPFVKPNIFRLRITNSSPDWKTLPTESLVKMSPQSTDEQCSVAERSAIEQLGLRGDYTVKEVENIRALMGLANEDASVSTSEAQGLAPRVLWDLSATTMENNPAPRRLVSLNEANDVARRLGEQETLSRYFSVNNRRSEDDDEDEEQDKEEDIANTVLREPSAWYDCADDADMEDSGLEKCSECGRYHE